MLGRDHTESSRKYECIVKSTLDHCYPLEAQMMSDDCSAETFYLLSFFEVMIREGEPQGNLLIKNSIISLQVLNSIFPDRHCSRKRALILYKNSKEY